MRRLYPNYGALRKALRRRTYRALRARAGTLGITIKRHRWTAIEASRLRRLYPTATRDEILAALPGLRWKQIKAMAKYRRLHRARKPLKPTGFPIIDDIRLRAFHLNLSMVDLDAMARTRCYFQKACWHSGKISDRAVHRAIRALDGSIIAHWN
jgi:hypothetical protein